VIWIFALGIIGFCIVSAGFRKLVFGLLVLVACLSAAAFAYNLYQSHLRDQQAALEREQERTDALKYPMCVGKDQAQAYLDSGGRCRQSTSDPEIDAAFAGQPVAKIKADKLRYAACDTKPFDPDKYLDCQMKIDGKLPVKHDSVDDIIPPSALDPKYTKRK
jgi:hypothetical protein